MIVANFVLINIYFTLFLWKFRSVTTIKYIKTLKVSIYIILVWKFITWKHTQIFIYKFIQMRTKCIQILTSPGFRIILQLIHNFTANEAESGQCKPNTVFFQWTIKLSTFKLVSLTLIEELIKFINKIEINKIYRNIADFIKFVLFLLL